MLKKRTYAWGKKSGVVLGGAAGLAALLFLVWLGYHTLDWDDPVITLKTPATVIGPKTTFHLQAGDRSSGLREVRVTLSQEGQEKEVLARTFPPAGEPGSTVDLPFTVEPKALGFKEGKATLAVTVRDRSWRNFFQGRHAALTKEMVIDLVPIRVSLTAISHLLHPGGAGCLVYRVNKPPKESGVLVGGRFYHGFPAPKGDVGEYTVLFPVPREPAPPVQVDLVARPAVGEEARQRLTLKLKPRRWRQDSINLSDAFLNRMAASFPVANPADPLQAFLEINRKIRQENHEKVQRVCAAGRPQPLWQGAFLRLEGKPMARFGDQRTYLWQGKAVDQQTHLGEDLADREQSPVPAGNHGVVVMAEPLGIYGQTVILDHGLGVFSMYSHLSKMDVKSGDEVKRGAILGRTGATGLAGGDHLHFSMIVQGEFVDPLEWWDPKWLKDQVEGLWSQGAAPPKAAADKKGKPGKTKAGPKKRRR
ncbi:MAG: M23 family metallopeptidase [Deltaproteobacteria bacterium]|nr:M23 family metallopeptidase [Deltaproteobacteria bacterium]